MKLSKLSRILQTFSREITILLVVNALFLILRMILHAEEILFAEATSLLNILLIFFHT